MWAIWIFISLFSFALSDNVLNNMVETESSTHVPLNEITFFASDVELPNMIVPNQLQAKVKPINTDLSECPNTAVLLTILNILTRSLPYDNKSLLEPEKFMYVLSIVKKILENTPHNPDNMNLYNKLKKIDEYLGKIYIPTTANSLRDRVKNKVKAKISLQYELPSRHQNCQEVFNILMNLIDSAYSRVMKYCEVTGKCYNNYVNNIPSIYSGYNPYYINTQNNIPVQESQNKFKKLPLYYPISKESSLAVDDLINFIKNQEGKGIHNILTILQNYRLKSDDDMGHVSNDSTRAKKSQLYINPENIYGISQIPKQHSKPNLETPNGPSESLLALPESNSKETLFKTIPWQSIGNPYENQQYSKLLAQKLYPGNNVGISNSMNTGVASYHLINGHIPNEPNNPVTNWNQKPNMNLLGNPSLNTVHKNIDSNYLYKIMKLLTNSQPQKAPTLYEKLLPQFPQVTLSKDYDNNPSLLGHNIHENEKFINIPFSIDSKLKLSDQNILNTVQPKLLTQSITYQPYSYGSSNQLYNPNTKILDLKQIVTPYVGTFANNKEQENYDNRLQDLNQLPGITNLDKLNSIPNNDGIVELTYMLERPRPINDPLYYVKYRLPYQSFLYNLQNLLIRKPYLRNEPNLIYQELLVGSNITDTSKDLKGLGYNEIIKLTTRNGTLVTAKILENNDETIDETLKIVQNLNSNLPLENLIHLNPNASDIPSLDLKKYIINDTTKDTVQSPFTHKYPLFLADVQRRLGLNQYINNPYKMSLNYNPYGIYQLSPSIYDLPLKYSHNLLKSNALNVPTVYSQNLLSTYPRLLGYGG